MIDLIPLPYKLAAIAVLLVIAFFAGRSNGLEQYYSFRAEVEAQQEALAEQAARAREESERINADTVVGWRAAADYWRDHPRTITVRVPASCDPSGLRPIPTAAPGLDATTAQREIGPVECEAIANNAVLDAAQLMWLQDWVKQQHEVKQ